MPPTTALIAGASRGIGREVARTLASDGWHVLSGVRDPKSALPGTQADAVDLADLESIEALARRLQARGQRLDALVNNAGVYKGTSREIWDVNVLGPLRLTRALEPLLARSARVVMVTSGLGQFSAQPASLVKRAAVHDRHRGATGRNGRWGLPRKRPARDADPRRAEAGCSKGALRGLILLCPGTRSS